MGEIQTYASNSGDFSFLFVLIIVGTYLLYEVGRAILDNNDDDDMDGGMTMRVACLLYTSPSPRDGLLSRMPSSA